MTMSHNLDPRLTNNYVDDDENGDYGIEQQSADDADEQYYDEKEQELAQLHIQAMIQQVIKLTEQCGDVNLAMTMMRLDAFEKSIVVRKL